MASRGSGHSTLRVLLYLDPSYRQYRREGRIRAPMMTVMALLLGLMPMMIGAETGADTMKRLAAPMIGGIVTTYVLALLIYPVIFYFSKRREVLRLMRQADSDSTDDAGGLAPR